MKNMTTLDWVSWVLVLIGGINWGFYGLFKFNIVEIFFGSGFFARIIYILVGAGAGYIIYTYFTKKETA